MREIVFETDFFTGDNHNRSLKGTLFLMEALVTLNKLYLKEHPECPNLYEFGVIYVPEFGTENWQTIPRCLKNKYGDCEDLACWRIAELRERAKIKARPVIKSRMVGRQFRMHALVGWPNGQIEDPSRALGMTDWSSLMQYIYAD